MTQPIGDCHCAYCRAPIDPAEARAAQAIIARFKEEFFWEVVAALGQPVYDVGSLDVFQHAPITCLDCVTQALFSLVVAPGGHVMLG
jgi:hypothetical protein